MKCPKCSAEVMPGAEFCDQCGASLKAAIPSPTPAASSAPPPPAPVVAPPPAPVAAGTVKCKTCGRDNPAGNQFCDNCGAPIAAQPMPAPPAPPHPVVPPPPGQVQPPAPRPATPPAPPTPVSPASAQPAAPMQPPAPRPATPLSPPTPVPPAPAQAAAPMQAPTPQPQPGVPPVTPTPAPVQATPPPQLPAPMSPPLPTPQPAPARPQMIPATTAAQPPPPGHPRIVVMPSQTYFDISGRPEVVIGRLDPVTPVIPDIDLTAHGGDEAGVSRRHCRITLAGNQYFVEDLGSSNGTTVNSVMLQPNVRAALNNGDQLRVGRLVFNFFTGQ